MGLRAWNNCSYLWFSSSVLCFFMSVSLIGGSTGAASAEGCGEGAVCCDCGICDWSGICTSGMKHVGGICGCGIPRNSCHQSMFVIEPCCGGVLNWHLLLEQLGKMGFLLPKMDHCHWKIQQIQIETKEIREYKIKTTGRSNNTASVTSISPEAASQHLGIFSLIWVKNFPERSRKHF